MEFHHDPVFWAGFAGAIGAGLGTWLIYKTKQQEKRHFLEKIIPMK